ncbi:MAG TPA: siphovirus Gp157 family protein [Candidatus Absconditabacterales bacterium]|nr:siphovirus Gp157 family protein [Candidatus Absconditabacterales bacterium]
MANLYEISKALEEVYLMVDEDGVFLPEVEEKLQELQMTEIEKFENLGKLLRNIQSDIEAFRSEVKRLSEIARVLENKENRIRNWLKFVLESKNSKTVKAGIFTFSLRAFESVHIEEGSEEKMDEKYLRIKKEANKTEIENDLKLGVDIPGASLVTSNSVIIK